MFTFGIFSKTALSSEKVKNLTFVTISTEEMAAMASRWEPTIDYISEKAGVNINYYQTTHMQQQWKHYLMTSQILNAIKNLFSS